MVHVFLVGSKGIPARYGGFETFVDNLTCRKSDPGIMYHVSCMDDQRRRFVYNDCDCFGVGVPLPGPAGRIFHVSMALRQVRKWRATHRDEPAAVYLLGCRIGPLIFLHRRSLGKLGVTIYCNPDGLEWKRGKWSAPARWFLRFCEASLVRSAAGVICDSVNIACYIRRTYCLPAEAVAYVPYGADVEQRRCENEKYLNWCALHGVIPGKYYLILGRFVPENNYLTMIREFMASATECDLLIVANREYNRFYRLLQKKTGFESDPRIKFVGSEYDPELVRAIREGAKGYLHGHEVGGTNPSLLEAMAAGSMNLLLDVSFNREVAGNCGLFWTKEAGSLCGLIDRVDHMSENERSCFTSAATDRIREAFNWRNICDTYEKIWLGGKLPMVGDGLYENCNTAHEQLRARPKS